MSTPLAAFGPGILIAQRTDIAIPSPVNVGFCQEFSIEIAGQTKSLYGQKQFPLVAARGTIKATGKFKSAVISGLAWNAMMYGESAFSSGGFTWTVDSTYTLTSTTVAFSQQIGSSTTFESDLGLKYAASGLPFQRVSTGLEAVGKYSLNASGSPGLYNFAAADTGALIKATYTSTTSSGQSLIVSNKMIGTTPTFQLDYYTSLNQPTSKPFVVRIYQSVMGKQGLGFKLEDFVIPEFDFDLFANASDNVYDFVFPEVS